jgi:hypothetical protein
LALAGLTADVMVTATVAKAIRDMRINMAALLSFFSY